MTQRPNARASASPPKKISFEATPAATGEQLVRTALPFPKRLVKAGGRIAVTSEGGKINAALRGLTCYPGTKSIRRGMVTFPYTFKTARPVRFELRSAAAPRKGEQRLAAAFQVGPNGIKITCKDGLTVTANLIAPACVGKDPLRVETVESNSCYLWQRFHFADPHWPRVIEVRADVLGGVVVVAHVQRNMPEDDYAPDLGWSIEAKAAKAILAEGEKSSPLTSKPTAHEFLDESPCTVVFEDHTLYHPAAPMKRKGRVEARRSRGKLSYTYYRCTAADKVPMQPASWQRVEFAMAPSGLSQVTVTLESPHAVSTDWKLWDQLYASGPPLDVAGQPVLQATLKRHHDAVIRMVVHGDDWGNVTGYSDDRSTGAVFGMNRLNHCPPMFTEGYRSGDKRLIEAAILWCDNMFDQSLWWGAGKTGGTRYNNVKGKGEPEPFGDKSYMWRSNDSVNFCTKGYDSFFIAYEETGDPRMLEALKAQVDYAAEYVHSDRGECRNIGDVRDFVRLHEYTGEKRYLDEALRLFRELRPKLSTGDLFDQGGKPLTGKLPYIETDADGSKCGFAKPYIIGYGLAGTPELGKHAPNEPKLRDMVRAVADFLANSQDPAGGWRYPHPRSSAMSMDQTMEHAWQLVQADALLGPKEAHLDAIERALRQRILVWQKSGRVFAGLIGWEIATGKVKTGEELLALYSSPEDRDFTKDYAEGSILLGSACPEGIVYFPEVLEFYLKHRPASRLLEAPRPDEPLAKLLARVAGAPQKSDPRQVPECGVKDMLPVFADRLAERLTFPMSWLSGNYKDFGKWKRAARAKVMECLLTPPPAVPFEPKVVSEQDRGSCVGRKIELNLTGDSRVQACMLTPKGKGPFPAVLLLHDHGARFDIGKEKVIKPWDCSPERLASAEEWANTCYGGRFIGDELAARGYVCLATDMLNWGDRGGGHYEGQQALAANLFHLGMSFAGLIAHEDLRAAEFLATHPEVDPQRVAAMGLSVGCFRTWQVAALSDHIKAGVGICWMATVKGLMVPGNNQTGGQSAYTMIHPGRHNYLDYPDVASLACPKPMLFYNGLKDALFPIPSVKEAYGKMQRVWDSQGAGDKLVTKLWDVPHCFSREMQDEAFAWLGGRLKPTRF